MKYPNRWIVLTIGLFTAASWFSACNKLDTTDIGNGLIPVVDNVNTFDTTLSVEATNAYYTDSLNIVASDLHAVGTISGDPLFGTTTASLLAQFKPAAFGTSPFLNVNDSIIAVDSVVMGLSFAGAYGDTNLLQRVRVYELDPSAPFYRNRTTDVAYPNFTREVGVGSGLVDVRRLRDSSTVILDKDTVKIARQLRIHLDTTAVGRVLTSYDTSNAFKSDSIFNIYNKGYAVVTDSAYGSNGLMYFNLTEANSNITVFYRVIRNGVTDTAFSTFSFGSTGTSFSAQANFIRRRYDGSAVDNYVNNGAGEDDLVFIQTLPGTQALLNIPALGGLSNRVIHKAELILEEVSDPSDAVFSPPAYVYLDAFDDSVHVAVIDPLFFSSGSPDLRLFGGYTRQLKDASGNTVRGYSFDLTRYVQMIATLGAKNLPLRLTAPVAPYNRLSAFHFNPLYPAPGPTSNSAIGLIGALPNNVAQGRIRLGGGNHATNKMRLRIIYSRI